MINSFAVNTSQSALSSSWQSNTPIFTRPSVKKPWELSTSVLVPQTQKEYNINMYIRLEVICARKKSI